VLNRKFWNIKKVLILTEKLVLENPLLFLY